MTIQDIALNPHRYGAPTFEEFQMMRARWTPRDDKSMVTLTDGPVNHRKSLKKIKYFIHGVELAGEDFVERALGDYGYTLSDIDLGNRDSRLKKEINYVQVGGGLDHDVHVNFFP